MESIGYRISKARRYRNMNQKELAKKAGITEASLSRYENEIREPRSQSLTQIADALEVSTDYLLGFSDEMEIKNNKLADKSPEDIEAILKEAEERISQAGIMFSGEPATQEAIDSVLTAMKIGLSLAIEKQEKNSK